MLLGRRLLVGLVGFVVGFGAVVPWWIVNWAGRDLALLQGVAIGLLSALIWPIPIPRPFGGIAVGALVLVIGFYFYLVLLILTGTLQWR